MALYIEGRRAVQLSEEERDRIADTLRLTESLGGDAVTLPAGDRNIADDVIGYARAHNVTQIIIGKSTRSRWFEILHGSVVHELVRRSGNISVHVIAGDQLPGGPLPKKTVDTSERVEAYDPRPYVLALARWRLRSAAASWSTIGSASRTSTWFSSPPSSASPCALGYCPRCSPASFRRWPTIFSSCRRSTP